MCVYVCVVCYVLHRADTSLLTGFGGSYGVSEIESRSLGYKAGALPTIVSLLLMGSIFLCLEPRASDPGEWRGHAERFAITEPILPSQSCQGQTAEQLPFLPEEKHIGNLLTHCSLTPVSPPGT